MARKRIKHEVTIVVNNSYCNNEIPILELYDYSDPITKIYVTGKVEFLTDNSVYDDSRFEYVISHIIRSYIDNINKTNSDSDRYMIVEKLKRDVPNYEKLLSEKYKV